jgi:SAM-dependent methyltransferase
MALRAWGLSLKQLVPRALRRPLRRALDTVGERTELLRIRLESQEMTRERSKRRWRRAGPDIGLTWGKELTGDAFVHKVASYGVFGAGRSILELGPGYGRLLRSCSTMGVPFASYCGVDVSDRTTKYLRAALSAENIRFVHGDIETIRLESQFDVFLSSLTMKHLFPSFETALRNIGMHMRPGGMLFFDLIEGKRSYFEDDRVTFLRFYERPEVLEILRAVGLEHVAFDYVEHAPGWVRLLTVARRPLT